MNYNVEYELDGKRKTETFDAYDIGQAYKKCLKDYPAAKIVAGHVSRRWLGGELHMTYPPVSTKSPEPLPKEVRLQSELELDDARKVKEKRKRAGK